MKFKFFLLCIIIVSCKTNLTTAETKSDSLFNGRDLNNWTVFGNEKWFVENQTLVCENGKDKAFGYLVTNKKYKNFELNLEFKQYAKSNGGVFVHSKLEGTNIKGLQVEIAVPGHHTAGIHSYDKGWLIKPDSINEGALKMGGWNHLKIWVKDSNMIVWLNNTKMVNLVDLKVEKGEGCIALQVHKGDDNKLQWRNINIKEL